MLSTGNRSQAGVEETRSRILAAARDLFESNGTRGTTTREVAIRAGVNEATLFRHFGSKGALLDAMREAACGVEEFRSAIAGLPGTDFASDLQTLASHMVARMVTKRAMMCISLAEDATGSEDSPEWRGPSQLVIDLAGYFASKIEAGALRGDPQFLARYFIGTLFSSVVGRRLWDRDAPDAETLATFVDIFLNGVRA